MVFLSTTIIKCPAYITNTTVREQTVSGEGCDLARIESVGKIINITLGFRNHNQRVEHICVSLGIDKLS